MTMLGEAKIDLVRYVDPAGMRKTEVLTRNTALRLMLELGERRQVERVRVRRGIGWWARMRNTIMEVV